MMGLNNCNPRFRVRVYLEWGKLLLNLSVSSGTEDWEMSRFLSPSVTGDATMQLQISALAKPFKSGMVGLMAEGAVLGRDKDASCPNTIHI